MSKEICRKIGVFEPTFYRWKRAVRRDGVSEIRLLKQLENESIKLKRVVADLTPDRAMLQDACGEAVKPVIRREALAI